MDKIYFPFYQVKVAGKVVDHTNNQSAAFSEARTANAKPAQVWFVQSDGRSALVLDVPA